MTDYLIKEDVFMALTGDITDCTIEEFITRLRDKLSKLPSVGKDINVTTNEDCISRQAVLELVGNYDLSMGQVVKAIHVLPSVTPKEKTGHWVNAKVGKLFPSNDFKCSECGNILDFDGVNCGRGDANYCPNCGCHMVEPQESEDMDGGIE